MPFRCPSFTISCDNACYQQYPLNAPVLRYKLLLLAWLLEQGLVLSATIIAAAVLVSVTVGVHVTGFALILKSMVPPSPAPPMRARRIARLILSVTWLLLSVHLAEIGAWALFYLFAHCFPDAESAFYFSGVTYTSVGYGDLVLPNRWRILAPIEALTGILMCGLSASLFFAIVSRIHAVVTKQK